MRTESELYTFREIVPAELNVKPTLLNIKYIFEFGSTVKSSLKVVNLIVSER
jgi:hypothetical protein